MKKEEGTRNKEAKGQQSSIFDADGLRGLRVVCAQHVHTGFAVLVVCLCKFVLVSRRKRRKKKEERKKKGENEGRRE